MMHKEKATKLIENFLSFLAGSPTACHAVENCVQALTQENFVCLKEEDLWKIKPGGALLCRAQSILSLCFYCTKNNANSAQHCSIAYG